MSLVDHELAQRVIARALSRGGDLGELYAEDRRGFAVSLDDGRIERPQAGSERGASVRVVRGEASYFGHVDGLDEGALLALAGSVAEAVRGDAREPRALDAAQQAPGHPVAERPETVDAERKAALLRACDERARAAGGEVAQVTAGYVEGRRIVEVYNSDGVAAADDRTRVRLSTQVVARRDGRVETGTDTRGGHAGFELVAEDPRRWRSPPRARP